MKNIFLSVCAFLVLCIGNITLMSCDDPEETSDLILKRVLSPTNISARVSQEVNIIVSWDKMDGATSYEVEAYAGSPDYGTRTPDVHLTTEETTITLSDLKRETVYYIRVRANDDENADRNSLWTTIERTTSE